jgi:hypothetical protein
MGKVYYKKGYKYQLVRDSSEFIGIFPPEDIRTDFIDLTREGIMTLKKGYASDGPSGPTKDTPSAMRSSFFHDGTYQLIRLGLLPQSCRQTADATLERMCLEDGMNKIRAALWRAGVEHFAAYAARYGTERPILTAP